MGHPRHDVLTPKIKAYKKLCGSKEPNLVALQTTQPARYCVSPNNPGTVDAAKMANFGTHATGLRDTTPEPSLRPALQRHFQNV